jgi:uncharacterized protein YvpB
MRRGRSLIAILSVLAMLVSVGLPAGSVSARNVGDGSAFVEVPLYTQQRNLSCEYASLVIALGAYDTWVSEWTFDELVPLSDNPHWGYRGDINGAWGNTTDYGVYPEPLVEPLAQLGFRGEVVYAKGDADALTRYLDNGVPVVLWLGMWGDQGYYEYAADGTPFKMNPGYHVVVAYGYDESGVYAADPATGSAVSWGWSDFMWMWDAMDGMALAVWPLARPAELESSSPAPPIEEITISDTAVCC